MPTLDDIAIESPLLTYHSERDGVRYWLTSDDDVVGLYHFPLAPDIGADLTDLGALRAFYRSTHAGAGAVGITLDTVVIDGCRVVRLISRIRQQPSGMTYLASLTIPFRDFSFVVKVEAMERGTTGVRETLMFGELLSAGRVHLDPSSGKTRGWTQDLDDPSLKDGPYANLAEAEQYDAQFPEHPLSRVRPILRHLSTAVRLPAHFRTLPPFIYPPKASHRPWWRFW